MSQATDAGGMRIPRETYLEEERRLRAEYEREFGADATSAGGEARSFTRAELVAAYAANLRFGRARGPVLAPGRAVPALARHALCTNADRGLRARCEEYGIAADVDRELAGGGVCV